MNKRQLKKMSRVAADWMIYQGMIPKSSLVFDAEYQWQWSYCWFQICGVGGRDNYSCIQCVFDAFEGELIEHDDVEPIAFPKGYSSMTAHKRLLFAIEWLRPLYE
ncbi:MAG: hypothetical protein KBC57_03310 [Neisseriaceae bacterium]|nr:hypothetical protein [Neisseriaceae bacterium]